MTQLIIQTGKHQGKKIDLAGLDCIIGRHESCKIRIASGEVSKQHCRLKHKKNGLYVKDLGSRNGTFLNEEPLTEEVRLKAGDTLRVGPMAFLISEIQSAPSPSSDAAGSSPSETSASAEGSGADDDLIAAWLSEGGDLDKSGHDSTVTIPSPVSKAATSQAGDSQSSDETPTASEKPASSADHALKSVRDRAQNIIRRWQKEHGKG